eukprot:5425751-Alexandrium_andersonii.AAC.1
MPFVVYARVATNGCQFSRGRRRSWSLGGEAEVFPSRCLAASPAGLAAGCRLGGASVLPLANRSASP